MTVAERFAEQLRVARARQRISQEDLAFRADIHRTQISFMESGKRMPRLDTFLKLAGALEMEPAELLGPIRWRPGIYEPGGFDLGEATPPR